MTLNSRVTDNLWPSNSRSNWNLEMLVFEGGGKPEDPEKNPRSKGTNNKLNPHMTPSPKIEPGPHWWEASALTTAPSLLPVNKEIIKKGMVENIKKVSE